MANMFYGLEIAKTGLFANQKGLELTGHNVANAATEGYTRQRLNLTSIEGPYTQVLVTSGRKATTGGGVNVNYIEQVRDRFLDVQYRNETADLKLWQSKAETFYYVEDIFNEPSDNGITSVMSSLYDSFQELQKTPDSKDIRNLVRQNAISLTETIQYYSRRIQNLQSDEDGALAINIQKANDLIKEIDGLNVSILKYEMNGEKANDLMDKRNLALDQLSELMDISVTYTDSNTVSVYFGKNKNIDAEKDSFCLVRGGERGVTSGGNAPDDEKGKQYEYYQFEIEKSESDYYGQPNMFHKVTLTSKSGVKIPPDGETVTEKDGTTRPATLGDYLTGGEIKANYICRDGKTSDNIGMPYILQQLDILAQGIAKAYNEVQAQGYGIPNLENGNTSVHGDTSLFFDDGNGDPSNINANNISISKTILESVYNIAASSKEVDLTAENTQIGNFENVQNFLNIATSKTLDLIGNVDDYIKSLTSTIGVEADHCNDMEENQQIMQTSVENQRYSVSGVSLDEEMTFLIQYMKAYSASSRVINTIDDMLEKLINGTGRCGL